MNRGFVAQAASRAGGEKATDLQGRGDLFFFIFNPLRDAAEKFQESFKKRFDTSGESPYKPRSPGHGAPRSTNPVGKSSLSNLLLSGGFCG
ncbi:hypothetical protein ACSHT0_15155 [Tepidicaulis sp. LMO-SS28]|uniref:hypothetical protein n=1 Tax=Tepidicaulis sp. LMO-SS28 TaxID=3447455 RepID=UPI003EE0CB5F